MKTKRRALVLTDESAGHPFLRNLPPHVRQGEAQQPAGEKRWRITGSDWRDFFITYCASFVAVAIFIA